MDLGIIIGNEAGQRQIPYNITYMWDLKYDTNELICETEVDSQTYRTDLRLSRGRRAEGRRNCKFEIRRCKLFTQ